MNVVFDFGGVLLRWAPQEFMPRLLPGRATDAAAVQALIDDFFEGFQGDWGRFDSGLLDAAQLASLIAKRTGIALADVQRVIPAVAAELQPLPEVVQILDSLRERGHRLWFLSNMPASYADAIDGANPIGSWFEGGLYSSRVRLRKPAAEIFKLLAERFDLDPAKSLFVDDSAHNIEAAQALGWQTLHFRDPAQCRAELVRRGVL